jgi:hypothetical protein
LISNNPLITLLALSFWLLLTKKIDAGFTQKQQREAKQEK